MLRGGGTEVARAGASVASRVEIPRHAPCDILVMAPGDFGGPLLELIGPHPLVACAAAAGAAVRLSIVTDEESVGRFTELPRGHRLLAVPLWRILPRSRAALLQPAGRLHAGLACLAALFKEVLDGSVSPDLVHGWGIAGALPAAAASVALGVPWAWSPPDPALCRLAGATASSEQAVWVAAWAAAEADALLCSDAAHMDAVRRAWAPPAARCVLLPAVEAAAGREREWGDEVGECGSHRESTGRTAGGADIGAVSGKTGPPRRVALLMGRGAAAADVGAVLSAVAAVRSGTATPPMRLLGVGCRQTEAAAALRRGLRRLQLAAGAAWRELDAGHHLPPGEPSSWAIDAAIVLGHEPLPRTVLAVLWWHGATVITWRAAARAACPAVARATEPEPEVADSGSGTVSMASAVTSSSDELAHLLAAALNRPERRRAACRQAWRLLCSDSSSTLPLSGRVRAAYTTALSVPGQSAAPRSGAGGRRFPAAPEVGRSAARGDAAPPLPERR